MTNLHDIATVTAAYLRHNRIAAGELSALISQIARTYQGLDGIPEAVAEKPQPVVSIRSSVKPDALTCLECGRTLKTLRSISVIMDWNPIHIESGSDWRLAIRWWHPHMLHNEVPWRSNLG